MSSSQWQRLAPILDVLGAVLIFGSWIASNALSQRAQVETNAHQNIVNRIRQHRLYEDFATRLRDIHSDLDKTHFLIEQQLRSSDADFELPFDTPMWTGITVTHVRQLNELLQDIKRYAEQISNSSSEISKLAQVRQEIETLSEEFRSARNEFDELNASNTPSRDADTELHIRIDALWIEYDSAKHNALELGDSLQQTAAAEAASASLIAKRFKWLSYVLYAIGTVIILYGRIASAKEKRSVARD